NFANPVRNRIRGYINPSGDRDYYSFDVEQDKMVLSLSLTPVNNVDLKLEILNALGEKIYALNSSVMDEGEIIPNLMLRKGRYYLAVSDLSNKRQNYLDAYTLKAAASELRLNWEYEPDDSFEQALSVSLNQSWNGYLAPGSDKDFYSLAVAEDRNLKLDVSGVPQIDFILQVYDQERNLVIEVNEKGKGEGESAIISFTPGNYYVILKDAENNNNSYESYLFSVFER
ncbi:MAG: hypothetical protein PHF84_12680, partial [bacterium]|nr:hypothetical protein [bacterium]